MRAKPTMRPFFAWPAAADDFLSVEVHVTSIRTEIIIMTTRTQKVLGEKGHHIRELTAVVQKLIRDLRVPAWSPEPRVPRWSCLGKIMLPWDPNGKIDPKEPLPENVLVVEPKDEIMHNTPGTKNNLKLGGGFTSLSVQDNRVTGYRPKNLKVPFRLTEVYGWNNRQKRFRSNGSRIKRKSSQVVLTCHSTNCSAAMVKFLAYDSCCHLRQFVHSSMQQYKYISGFTAPASNYLGICPTGVIANSDILGRLLSPTKPKSKVQFDPELDDLMTDVLNDSRFMS
ncbi:ribosomal protein S3 [Culex quinquefasciatus]|uniref:Ribosomal protein S3 n=1 Tax=Culex quinquefasciatus TaxID=7176 RepID=B0WB73_CULQU|nr:ribosomal protein S3 [Culex quinquefasciatus]|eukprot:XP_001845957.1 ribosomal protein S3 [Culex quinquefasciatus]